MTIAVNTHPIVRVDLVFMERPPKQNLVSIANPVPTLDPLPKMPIKSKKITRALAA